MQVGLEVLPGLCLCAFTLFFVPQGTNNLCVPRGQTFSTYSGRGREGVHTFLHTGGANMFTQRGDKHFTQGGIAFSVGGGGQQASKLSAGARILGSKGP